LDIGLDIYGDGPLRFSLPAYARELGVADLVELHGRTNDIGKAYRTALATIVPSHIEPFGMVAIESMAAGTPAIASYTGGLIDIIENGVSGLHFEPGNASDLAGKIRAIAISAQRAESLVQAARRRVQEKYDGTRSLQRFEALLDEAIGGFAGYGDDESIELDALRVLAKARHQIYQVVPGTARHAQAEQELTAIKNSTYWRMGAPMRNLLSNTPWLRKGLRDTARFGWRTLNGRLFHRARQGPS
jgi:hypothetical protein